MGRKRDRFPTHRPPLNWENGQGQQTQFQELFSLAFRVWVWTARHKTEYARLRAILNGLDLLSGVTPNSIPPEKNYSFWMQTVLAVRPILSKVFPYIVLVRTL